MSVSSKSSDSDEIGAWMGSPAGYCEDSFEVPIQLLYPFSCCMFALATGNTSRVSHAEPVNN
jgi:hypothetical protein